MIESLLSKRRGGDVKRFHTQPMLNQHLVSSHSFGVALCVLYMTDAPSVNLLKACLYHDLEEVVVGDMPATTKWAYPDLAKALHDVEAQVTDDMGLTVHLTDYEKELLKAADMGDLVLNCLDEYRMGNRDALDISKRGIAYLEERLISKRPLEFLAELRQLTREVENGR